MGYFLELYFTVLWKWCNLSVLNFTVSRPIFVHLEFRPQSSQPGLHRIVCAHTGNWCRAVLWLNLFAQTVHTTRLKVGLEMSFKCQNVKGYRRLEVCSIATQQLWNERIEGTITVHLTIGRNRRINSQRSELRLTMQRSSQVGGFHFLKLPSVTSKTSIA